MKDRFEPIRLEDAWMVLDNEADKYDMPRNATSLYLKDFTSARLIADILNRNWLEFLRNPT